LSGEIRGAAIHTEGGFGTQFVLIITAMAFSLLMKIDAIYMTRPFLWIGVNNLTAL
jgi:hypothetical protein